LISTEAATPNPEEPEMADQTKDRLDIMALAVNFSSSASRFNSKRLSETFTEDGRIVGVAKLVGMGDIDIVGQPAISDFFAPLFASFDSIHHNSQVTDLEVDGDKATAVTMIMEHCRPKGNTGKMLIVMGDYADEIVRTPDGWRFAKRTLSTRAFTFVQEANG